MARLIRLLPLTAAGRGRRRRRSKPGKGYFGPPEPCGANKSSCRSFSAAQCGKLFFVVFGLFLLYARLPCLGSFENFCFFLPLRVRTTPSKESVSRAILKVLSAGAHIINAAKNSPLSLARPDSSLLIGSITLVGVICRLRPPKES